MHRKDCHCQDCTLRRLAERHEKNGRVAQVDQSVSFRN